MAAVYRERVSDARLRKVTDYIRRWLYGRPASSLRLHLPSISMWLQPKSQRSALSLTVAL